MNKAKRKILNENSAPNQQPKETGPVFWVRFVSDGEGWEPPVHHRGMTSEMIKSGRYTPLYAHPMPDQEPFTLALETLESIGNEVIEEAGSEAWHLSCEARDAADRIREMMRHLRLSGGIEK